MKIAILSSIAWSTPPKLYGPWEQVASTIAEGMVARGHEVTLFATGDSKTQGKLEWVSDLPYAESDRDAKVWECLHISNVMEQADQFDIIHNHFDFLPLTYSKLIKTPMITTIHGFSSERILPVYQKYNETSHYISISDADRNETLSYLDTIYHGINEQQFDFREDKEDTLLYFGRIHPDKGTYEAIQIALKSKKKLIIAGLVQDQSYFDKKVKPYLDSQGIEYVGNVGPEERNKILGKAKALLHPISFNEPFGLSVAEAMMCGTPVIAFNKGSMSELIAHEQTGFLVHSVEEAVAAVDKLEGINARVCRERALQLFSLETMLTSYETAYTHILNN